MSKKAFCTHCQKFVDQEHIRVRRYYEDGYENPYDREYLCPHCGKDMDDVDEVSGIDALEWLYDLATKNVSKNEMDLADEIFEYISEEFL